MAHTDGAPAPVVARRSNRKRSAGLVLSAILTALYLSYLALVIYVPSAMSTAAVGNLTWGLALGIAVILSALALGFVYVTVASAADRAGGQP